jgi:hypothetical protein
MVTCDQNIAYQQNLLGRQLGFVVLSTNDWNVLKHNLQLVVEAVNAATRSSFQFVKITPRRRN